MSRLPWRRRWIEEGESLALDELGLLPFEGSLLDAANPGLVELGDVEDAVAAFEAGDIDGYWQAQMWLFPDERSLIRNEHWTVDLRGTPGWTRIAQELRERIVDGAERYLREGAPGEPHRAPRTPLRPAWAGYRALYLLHAERRKRFETLGDDEILRWLPIMVAWPRTADEPPEFADLLLRRANEIAPERVAEGVGERLEAGVPHGDLSLALSDLEAIWSESLEGVLLQYLEHPAINSGERARLLQRLLEYGSTAALALGRRLVCDADLRDEAERATAVDFAEVIADNAPDGGWEFLWPLIVSDDEFGELLIGRLASMHGTPLLELLDPAELAALWRWLVVHFPPEDDPPTRGGPVTPAVEVEFWRSRIIEAITQRGTSEAVSVLAALSEQFPNYPWLRRFAHEADTERRRTEWTAPAPSEVVRLGAERSARYVADAPALRALVVESLDRAQEQMHAHTPLAPDFWNTKPNRPKSENEISDRLVRFLRDDIGGRRVVVNREVQVNPRPGGHGGDRTDIHVEAFDRSGDRLLTIVEVKGAWNRDLDTAMQNQLVETYMAGAPSASSVYLIAWADASEWDADSARERDRRTRATQRGVAELRSLFIGRAEGVEGADVKSYVLDISLVRSSRSR
jgi:hypothetical protein